jgi:hypothetical protein
MCGSASAKLPVLRTDRMVETARGLPLTPAGQGRCATGESCRELAVEFRCRAIHLSLEMPQTAPGAKSAGRCRTFCSDGKNWNRDVREWYFGGSGSGICQLANGQEGSTALRERCCSLSKGIRSGRGRSGRICFYGRLGCRDWQWALRWGRDRRRGAGDGCGGQGR